MDEREAIERLKRGDITGLELLVRQHQLEAVRAAYLVTHDLALAQDVVQSGFLKAYERIDQFDATRPFGPWFYRTVLRDAIKAASRAARAAPLENLEHWSEPLDSGQRPDEAFEQAETAEEVAAVLRQLTPTDRAAIVARYFLGLSELEMSHRLKISRTTVRWRLHVARQRLRLLLNPLSSD